MTDPEGAAGPSDESAAPAPERAGGDRRALVVVGVLLAAAAALLWGSTRLAWVTYTVAADLTTSHTGEMSGADWSPWLTPLALVLLAGVAATAATKKLGRRIVAVVVALAGAFALASAVWFVIDDQTVIAAAQHAGVAAHQLESVQPHRWTQLLVGAAGLVCVVAAVVALRSARAASGMSARYETPAARRAELERAVFADREGERDVELSERQLWESLDTGDDPTTGRPG